MTPGLIERLEAAGEHTPGPWFEDEAGICACDRLVAIVALPDECCGADPDSLHDSVRAELSANARLIASAPDLLEALIEALPYVESCEYDNGYKPGAVAKVVRNMNAAILKARATQEQG